MKSQKVASFVEKLQSRGRYTFSRKDVDSVITGSKEAIQQSLGRLIKKGRLLCPRRGFYVIVPLEHQSSGTLPVSWFIDKLMNYLKQPYYVGLLSAAALHGASHQAVQEFQVITNKPQRNIPISRYRIRFATKQKISTTPIEKKQVPSGTIPVSTPEATALDLLRYTHLCGGIHHVATVLTELAEAMDPKKLLETISQSEVELPYIQRLGYLLEFVGAKKALTNPLAKWLKKQNPHFAPLLPRKKNTQAQISNRWFLFVNEHVESDI